jgi:hypothetical protein
MVSSKEILMKKSILFLLICALALTGCKKALNEALSSLGIGGSDSEEGEYDRAENAEKVTKEIRYYNDFLGVSYSVPKGWWLYDLNQENLSEFKGDITDDYAMDISYDDYDGKDSSRLWILSFGNLQSDTHDNHLGFDIGAWAIEGVTSMPAYMNYFEEYMLEPEEDATYKMTDSQQITINGIPFELRDYLVDRVEDDFQIVTYSCRIKEGYFLNIIVDYWPQHTKARQVILDSITKSLELY